MVGMTPPLPRPTLPHPPRVLQGLDDPQLVFQAQLRSLRGRQFEDHPSLLPWGHPAAPHTARRLSHHLRRAASTAEGLGGGGGGTWLEGSPRHFSLSFGVAERLSGPARTHSFSQLGGGVGGGSASGESGGAPLSARQQRRQRRQLEQRQRQVFDSISRHGSHTAQQQHHHQQQHRGPLGGLLHLPRLGGRAEGAQGSSGPLGGGREGPGEALPPSDTNTPTWLQQQQQQQQQSAWPGGPASSQLPGEGHPHSQQRQQQRSWLGRLGRLLTSALGTGGGAPAVGGGGGTSCSPLLPTSCSDASLTAPMLSTSSSTMPSFCQLAPAGGSQPGQPHTFHLHPQQQQHPWGGVSALAPGPVGRSGPATQSSGGGDDSTASFSQSWQQRRPQPLPPFGEQQRQPGGGAAAAAAAADAAVGGDRSQGAVMRAPLQRRVSSLRDAADWSYPGSTLATPTCQEESADAWEESMAVEAARYDAVAGGPAQAQQGGGGRPGGGGQPASPDAAWAAAPEDVVAGLVQEEEVDPGPLLPGGLRPPTPALPAQAPAPGPAAQAAAQAAPGAPPAAQAAAAAAVTAARAPPTARVPAPPRRLQQLQLSETTLGTGLESLDLVTPGVAFARQVAQLFVDGRRWGGGGCAEGRRSCSWTGADRVVGGLGSP